MHYTVISDMALRMALSCLTKRIKKILQKTHLESPKMPIFLCIAPSVTVKYVIFLVKLQ